MPNIKYLYFRPEANLLCTYDDAKQIVPSLEFRMTEQELTEIGFARLYPSEVPTVTEYQELKEINPILSDGQYIRQYVVEDLFKSDIVQDDGTILTIDMQKQQYDAMRLMLLKRQLLIQIEQRHVQKLKAGIQVTVDDISDVFDLNADSMALLYATYFIPSTNVSVFGRKGAYSANSNGYNVIRDSVCAGLVAIHQARADAILAVNAAQTLEQARSLELNQ